MNGKELLSALNAAFHSAQGSSLLKNNQHLKTEGRYREDKNPLKTNREGAVNE